MQPYQQRVIDEQDALKWKLDKLLDFLEAESFKMLPKAEQGLLRLQSFLMTGYYEVLKQRIEAFEP